MHGARRLSVCEPVLVVSSPDISPAGKVVLLASL